MGDGASVVVLEDEGYIYQRSKDCIDESKGGGKEKRIYERGWRYKVTDW